jgi:hypothetical protein
MQTKIKKLLGSLRFWIVTLTAITAVLSSLSDGQSVTDILDIVTIYLGSVAAIGTLDSLAEKSAIQIETK